MPDAATRPADIAVCAPAKVNLHLEVLGRRPDGYHDICTVMQAVSLCDELRLTARADGRVLLTCTDPALPVDDRNLVVRAALALKGRSGTGAGAEMHLVKRIPSGGGLGGGSSDCAIALLALNSLWGLGAAVSELAEVGSALGSDVAFFLQGGTALCEGRGERVSPVPCATQMHYLLVTPDMSVSTADVYASFSPALTRSAPSRNNVIRAIAEGSLGPLGSRLRNDLQEPALRLHGGLQRLWNELEGRRADCRATVVSLSGSGATFLMALPDEASARVARMSLERDLGAACGAVHCRAVHSLPAWNGTLDMLRAGRMAL